MTMEEDTKPENTLRFVNSGMGRGKTEGHLF